MSFLAQAPEPEHFDGSESAASAQSWEKSRSPLPGPLTSFVGRHAETASIIELLRRQDVRLVTFTGPGGIGKTRLAVETARQIAPAFRDGVRFVSLEAVTDPDLVVTAIARAIGVATSTENVERSLHEEIADQHLLLVVDNLEQVVSAAPVLSRILQAGPDVKLLATSRVPLRITAEQVFETPPLALPADADSDGDEASVNSEAVQLFIARAVAANPHLPIDAESIAAIGQICERLDGFPLAIELAAARSSLLSPPAILARLDHRLALLTSGARDQPRRLQSLRDAIGWSYDLLEPREQALFRSVCVFAGPFSIDALESVSQQDDGELLDTLSALIDSSLVRQIQVQQGSSRYAVFETIREFGLERMIELDEVERYRDRHAAYFAKMAAGSRLSAMMTDRAYLDEQDANQNNLREGLNWLVEKGAWDDAHVMGGDLAWYWYQRGFLLEGRRRLEQLIGASPATTGHGPKSVALIGLGLLVQASGNVKEARPILEEAVACATEAGESLDLAMATGLLAGVLTTIGDAERAEELFVANQHRWDAEHRDIWFGHADFHRGLIALQQDRIADASDRFAEALVSYDRGDGELYAVDPLQYLGLVSLRLGDLSRASFAFGEAIARLEIRKSLPDLAMGIASVAALAERLRRYRESVILFAAARELRDLKSLPFPEPAASMYEEFQRRSREALSQQEADELEHEGQALPLDAAIAAARAILAGGTAVNVAPTQPDDPFGLTEREREVLLLVADGRTNDQIAAELFISNGTARTHVARILAKLDAHTRTEAAGIARKAGLV